VALHSSSLKRLSEETRTNPQNSQIHVGYYLFFVCIDLLFSFILIIIVSVLLPESFTFELIKVEMKRLKDEIKEKSEQIDLLEKQMSNYFIASEQTDQSGVSQVC